MIISDVISIDRNLLRLNNLTISEFLYLKLLFFKDKLTPEDIANTTEVMDEVNLQKLEDAGYIKIGLTDILFRGKTESLFKLSTDNFFRFVGIFPIKTPSGRYLSPKELEGVGITKIRKKWDSVFKHNKSAEDEAISVLEAEITWRNKNNQMEYMHNMETWLNKGDYNNMKYLLDEPTKPEVNNYDIM